MLYRRRRRCRCRCRPLPNNSSPSFHNHGSRNIMRNMDVITPVGTTIPPPVVLPPRSTSNNNTTNNSCLTVCKVDPGWCTVESSRYTMEIRWYYRKKADVNSCNRDDGATTHNHRYPHWSAWFTRYKVCWNDNEL
jgi:hypothetical protein